MNFIRKILGRVRLSDGKATPPSADMQALQDALERGRAAKREGQYDRALDALDRAADLIEKIGEQGNALYAIVGLSRAGMLAKLARWEAARQVLHDLKDDAEHKQDQVQLAYVEISLGILAQEQAEWAQAEAHYESALDLARAAESVGAEGRAQAHMADVALHDKNASFAVYLLKQALPKLNDSGDIELSSYFVGRLGEALIASGEDTEGTQLLGQALRLAEQMGYREYEQLWHQALAQRALVIGNYPEARRHYMQVLPRIKRDEQRVYVLCRLSRACLHMIELQTALDYARQAYELAQDQSTMVMASAALGVALRTQGASQQAMTHLEAAYADFDAVEISPADYTRVDVMRNLAAARAQTGDQIGAHEIYQQALTQAADMPFELAGTQRDLGILYTQQGQLGEAVKAWIQALKIYEQHDQPARVARLHCDIANLRKRLGQPWLALEDYSAALMLLSSVDDDETRGIVLSNAATAYVDQGDVETAESFFIDSIKLAQKTGDRHAEATRRGNYGWFLMSTGRAERALASLSYALRQSEELGMTLQMAVQTDNIGLAYAELGRYDEALTYHRQALNLLDEPANAHWQAMIAANMAHTLIGMGDLEAAHPLLTEAADYGREQNDVNIHVRALNGLAQVAVMQDDLTTAQRYIEQAVSLAEQMHMRRLLADAVAVRSQIYSQRGDPAAASTDWARAEKLYTILRLPLQNRKPNWMMEQAN
jgi:tetratricopeptide (TPR) repeat protein